MDRFANKTRTAALLAAGAVLAAGCSRSDAPAETAADATTTDTMSAPTDISIPGTGVFPESITARSDGTLYIGSVGKAQIYRVAPGESTAQPFIQPGTGGMKQIFGVFADEGSNTLWACSNQLGAGPPGSSPPQPSALHGFDLETGAAKASHALPEGGMCNDIAVGANGDVYASDTSGMQVLRLADGAALEAWSPAGAFGPAGGVLDGIAVVGGRVIVNTLATNKLFAVEVAPDGKAGKVTELVLSAPLSGPDGMRAYGDDAVLTTDSTGKIQHVVISGDNATVTAVKDGLDGPVSVAVVGDTGYALEGQLAIMFAPPGGTPPQEKPYRAVAFPLP